MDPEQIIRDKLDLIDRVFQGMGTTIMSERNWIILSVQLPALFYDYPQLLFFVETILARDDFLMGPYDFMGEWFYINQPFIIQYVDPYNLTQYGLGRDIFYNTWDRNNPHHFSKYNELVKQSTISGFFRSVKAEVLPKIYLYRYSGFVNQFKLIVKAAYILCVKAPTKIVWPESLKLYIYCLLYPSNINKMVNDTYRDDNHSIFGNKSRKQYLSDLLDLTNYRPYSYFWMPNWLRNNLYRLNRAFYTTYSSRIQEIYQQAIPGDQLDQAFRTISFFSKEVYDNSTEYIMTPFDLHDMMINLWMRGYPTRIPDNLSANYSKEVKFPWYLSVLPPGPSYIADQTDADRAIGEDSLWKTNSRSLYIHSNENSLDKFRQHYYGSSVNTDYNFMEVIRDSKFLLPGQLLTNLLPRTDIDSKSFFPDYENREYLGLVTPYGEEYIPFLLISLMLYAIKVQGIRNYFAPRYSTKLVPGKVYTFLEVLDYYLHSSRSSVRNPNIHDLTIIPSPLMGHWISKMGYWIESPITSLSTLLNNQPCNLPTQIIGMILGLSDNLITSLAHQFYVYQPTVQDYLMTLLNWGNVNIPITPQTLDGIRRQKFLFKMLANIGVTYSPVNNKELYQSVADYLYLIARQPNSLELDIDKLGPAIDYLLQRWEMYEYMDKSVEQPMVRLTRLLSVYIPDYKRVFIRNPISPLNLLNVQTPDFYNYTDLDLIKGTGVFPTKSERPYYVNLIGSLYDRRENQWFIANQFAAKLPLSPPPRPIDMDLFPWEDIPVGHILGYGQLAGLRYKLYSLEELVDAVELVVQNQVNIVLPYDPATSGQTKLPVKVLEELSRFLFGKTDQDFLNFKTLLDQFIRLYNRQNVSPQIDQAFASLNDQQKAWLKRFLLMILEIGFRARNWTGTVDPDWINPQGLEPFMSREVEVSPAIVVENCQRFNQQLADYTTPIDSDQIVRIVNGRYVPIIITPPSLTVRPGTTDPRFFDNIEQWFRTAYSYHVLSRGSIDRDSSLLWEMIMKVNSGNYCIQVASSYLIASAVKYLQRYYGWKIPFDINKLGRI